MKCCAQGLDVRGVEIRLPEGLRMFFIFRAPRYIYGPLSLSIKRGAADISTRLRLGGVKPHFTGRIGLFLRIIENNKKPLSYREHKELCVIVLKTSEMTFGV